MVRAMRAQLPAAEYGGGDVFVGPAELVRDLVRGTLRNVVDALSDSINTQLRDRDACRRLVETATAAFDWARTVAECQEVELFSFDPCGNPTLRHSADH
jgi:hypothetical protein